MPNNQQLCDPQRVELFLQQKLSDDEQAAFELHLDDCQACRRQLETTAAGDDAWSACATPSETSNCRVHTPLYLRERGGGEGGGGPYGLDSATGEEASSSQATILKLWRPRTMTA